MERDTSGVSRKDRITNKPMRKKMGMADRGYKE